MLRGVFALLIFFSVAISYSYQLDSTVVSIPFCEDQSESFCNKCNSGYEISNTKRCRITNCLFYDYEQDLCLQCMTGFLRIANTCV